jgi:hypothetical protein
MNYSTTLRGLDQKANTAANTPVDPEPARKMGPILAAQAEILNLIVVLHKEIDTACEVFAPVCVAEPVRPADNQKSEPERGSPSFEQLSNTYAGLLAAVERIRMLNGRSQL